MKTQRSSSIWCLGRLSFVIMCLSSTLVEAKSINNKIPSLTIGARSRDKDPMLAMPSDEGQRQYEHQEVHYVTSYQPVQPAADHHQPQQQQQQAGGQEIVIEYQVPAQVDVQHQQQYPPQQQQQQPPQQYQQQVVQQQVIYTRPQYQLVQMSAPAAPPQALYSGQREQGATGASEQTSDYPGEIVYLGQNGEDQQQGASLASVADSGLSATILTEIPLKDMPAEVLNKLRREYGVKVVATRERPGANLVISCDEHPTAGQGSLVCNKQSEHTSHAHHQGSPVEYRVEHEMAPPQGQQGHEAYHHGGERNVVDELLQNDQPQYHHSQQGPAAPASAGGHTEQPGHHGQADEGRPAANEQPRANSEYYSSRTAAPAVEQPTEPAESYEARSSDPTNGDNSSAMSQEHPVIEPASPEAPSSASAHEEADQSAGFDEPKGDGQVEYSRE